MCCVHTQWRVGQGGSGLLLFCVDTTHVLRVHTTEGASGTTLATVATRKGWWRPTINSVNFSKCWHDKCAGGVAEQSTEVNLKSNATCADGTFGPWCQRCADSALHTLTAHSL